MTAIVIHVVAVVLHLAALVFAFLLGCGVMDYKKGDEPYLVFTTALTILFALAALVLGWIA